MNGRSPFDNIDNSSSSTLRLATSPLNAAADPRTPGNPVELTEEQMAEVEVILEKIEEDDDVQVVFTNLA